MSAIICQTLPNMMNFRQRVANFRQTLANSKHGFTNSTQLSEPANVTSSIIFVNIWQGIVRFVSPSQKSYGSASYVFQNKLHALLVNSPAFLPPLLSVAGRASRALSCGTTRPSAAGSGGPVRKLAAAWQTWAGGFSAAQELESWRSERCRLVQIFEISKNAAK